MFKGTTKFCQLAGSPILDFFPQLEKPGRQSPQQIGMQMEIKYLWENGIHILGTVMQMRKRKEIKSQISDQIENL